MRTVDALVVPTAMHACGPLHDTEYKAPPETPGGCCTMCHTVPSQRSRSGLLSGPSWPTATHAVGLVHETPMRRLACLSGFLLVIGVQSEPFHISMSVV